MIRIFDFVFSFIGLVILSPLLIILLIICYLETGSPIFRQKRVGKGKEPFHLIKFRSMLVSTPTVATHLVNANSMTPFGRFMRRLKLDELPQLFNVLIGDMSLVGPRPNLFNQQDLIKERDSRGVYSVLPGITGLAQINRIDMSTPELLAETDAKMIQELNTLGYLNYIFLTAFGKGFGDRVRI